MRIRTLSISNGISNCNDCIYNKMDMCSVPNHKAYVNQIGHSPCYVGGGAPGWNGFYIWTELGEEYQRILIREWERV